MDEGQVPGSALAPHQVAARLQDQVADGITWARRRKAKFRRSAAAIRIVSLVLAVTSTIILDLQQLNFWTGLVRTVASRKKVPCGIHVKGVNGGCLKHHAASCQEVP